jgi:vacuolar-type H+-ATPase subunit I/STV1
MADLGSEQAQVPVQTIEKPTSVTVFGILNIVFGGLLLLCSPLNVAILMSSRDTETATIYKIWSLLTYVVGTGLGIWLLTLGIGLLKRRKWARNGTIIFACSEIVFIVSVFGVRFLALYLGWIKLPQGILPDVKFGVCVGLIWLIYPMLLLIFMKTEKVKRAFAAIGG